MPADLQLGEDECPVDRYLKCTAGAHYQPDRSTRKRPFDFGRQTGSPGFIVSNGAKLNGDLHHRSFPKD
jgi:hypothetical protein